jgi:DNA-binding NarL/FixJ family response regulator
MRWTVTSRQGPVRVLIVDDSAPFRRAARDLLRRRGYFVIGEAATAATAREQTLKLAPDALLLDVRLPDGCGFELSSTLTRAHPDLAVLLVSSEDLVVPDARIEASGARGFVPKDSLAATPLGQFWPIR